MPPSFEWHLEKRMVKDLMAYPLNPRILTEKQYADLRQSLDKFGFIEKPIINTNGTIIGGHQRLAVLNLPPEDEIEVWVPNRHLNAQDVAELNIRLNKNSAEWDWDALSNNYDLDELTQWGFSKEDLGLGGFDAKMEEENSQDVEKCPECNQKIKK